MHIIICLIIVHSVCAEETKKFVPGRSVVLKCKLNDFNSTVTWFYENTWIWDGIKFNTMYANEGRYNITDNNSLRITKPVNSDAGTYTCIHKNINVYGKHKIILLSMLFEQTNSTHSESQDSDNEIEQTTYLIIPDDQKEVDKNHDKQKCLNSAEWIVYSLISMSILSAVVISLLCVLVYKYRKSHYNHSGSIIHNIASESVELNNTPHVYHTIDENRVNARMPDNDMNVEIESEGTHSSNQSDHDLIQYEEPEYLHPYHSLITVNDTERQDYKEIMVQHQDDVHSYANTSGSTDPITTQIHHLSENRTLNYIECESEGFRRTDVHDNIHNKQSEEIARHTTKNTEQQDPNNQFVSIGSNITIVNQIDDNISLD